MEKIKIKSAFMTKIGKLEDDFPALAKKAARGVLARRDPGGISRVYFSSFAPTALGGVDRPLDLVSKILIDSFPSLKARFFGPYQTGGEALFNCLEAFGSFKGDALVLGCEKMTHMRASLASGILPKSVNPFERSYGATLPSLGALVTRLYQSKHSIPEKAFHAVSVKNHSNAILNPKAQFHRKITIEEVASSPMVSDPLRRLHCAPISDGAAAVVLSRENGDVTINSWERGTDAPLFHERRNIERFRATAAAARKAFSDSKVSRGDIDVVEVHDAFSPFELINLEEMGFFPPGHAWRALLSGDCDINSPLAVNPSGGMKARGHPIGVCGLSSLVEVYEQLTFSAGKRQQQGAKAAAIQSAGGVSRKSFVFILST